MTRGPTQIPSKGACIYCRCTGIPLTDEHVVPYSLGGSHVLKKASCLACADITKKFEQKVARDLWGDARHAYGAPTRRKRERKTHILINDAQDPTRKLKVPANEYPAGLVFYKMDRAGLLQGLPEPVDVSGLWQFSVVNDDVRREAFLKKYSEQLTIKFRHVPQELGRLLAKIGYCQILTSLDLEDFRPICLPYILGQKQNVSYVVGGSLEDGKPDPENGYSLTTVGFGSTSLIMLVALVRLYANTHAPAYHVVVGDVAGPENVKRVLNKLGVADPQSLSTSSDGHEPSQNEHWLPRAFPLPFWMVR